MYPPNDFNVCLLAVVLMKYHEQQYGHVRLKPTPPQWVRTPAQEAIRELSARMAP